MDFGFGDADGFFNRTSTFRLPYPVGMWRHRPSLLALILKHITGAVYTFQVANDVENSDNGTNNEFQSTVTVGGGSE